MIRSASSHRNKGFTLIEILVYAAITTVILTFGVLTLYQFVGSADRLRNLKEIAENKAFLEQKIIWTLQGVSAINSPSAGATTTSLSVTKINFSDNPVVIDLSDGVARLKRGSNAVNPITNEYVEVKDLTFHNYDLSGRPAIKVNATLFNNYTSTTIDVATTILTK